MCGIAGAIWTNPARGIDAATLRRMTDAIRERGPDDEGTLVSEFRLRPPYEPLPGVALGFRRLKIIDLAGGAQPMGNEDGQVQLVFNGEIYNFPSLRLRLEGAGHRFRSHSDTETIVHLYEDEGVDCFRHLDGMFAIALWDQRQRRLVLARDRLGEKPLVYRAESDRLLFGSALRSLLEVPGLPRDVDPNALDEYLTYQYVPHPHTIYRGFHKLPPGHYAIWQDGRLEVRPYWQPDWQAEREIEPRAAVERVRELVEHAVTSRMRSDVPLGAFLSGGVDSSLVVALMQRHSSTPVKTFTIGFPIASYDESAYARRVAKHLRTDHHELQVTPDAVAILPQLVRHYDEPMSDSSAIPTWYLAEFTRRQVTVALTGDGGDELFAGYSRYAAVALSEQLDRHPFLHGLLSAPIWQKLPGGGRQRSLLRRFKRFNEALAQPIRRRYLDWVSIFNESRRAELYDEQFVARLTDVDPAEFLTSAWRRADRRDAVTAASLTDLTTYLPCDLLTKVDVASMAHSLECRQPLLEHQLVEFAASLPLGLKYRRGRGKRILREAFGDLLPSEVFTRKKMGFGVPLDHWFRHELRDLVHDALLDQTARGRGWFRQEVVERMVREHCGGTFDHSYRLWSLIVLELWARRWLDRPGVNGAGEVDLSRPVETG